MVYFWTYAYPLVFIVLIYNMYLEVRCSLYWYQNILVLVFDRLHFLDIPRDMDPLVAVLNIYHGVNLFENFASA